MKVFRKKSIVPILLLYFLMIVISIGINGFGKFNSIPVLIFCFVWLLYIRDFSYYLWLAFLAALIAVFSFANGVSFLHVAVDVFELAFILGTIYLCDKFYFPQKVIKFSVAFIAILLFFSIVGMGFPRLYEFSTGAYRYNGIFGSGNSSSNTFLMLSILFWEFFKRLRKNSIVTKLVLVVLVLAFLMYVLASQTRSMLMALPYWLYQFSLLFGKKTIFSLAIIVVVSASAYLATALQEKLRMTEDASFLTRLQLYETEIEGIVANYVIIPHGAHKAWELAIDLTMNDQFSPHNDFLRFLYDWGIAFILLLIIFYKRIKKRVGFDVNICLLLLAQSSCLLHNMWFLPIVWLPILIVFNLKCYKRYEQNVNTCKKI